MVLTVDISSVIRCRWTIWSCPYTNPEYQVKISESQNTKLADKQDCTVNDRNTNTLYSLCSEHRHIILSMHGTQPHYTVYARNTGTLYCQCSEHKHIIQYMLGTQTHYTLNVNFQYYCEMEKSDRTSNEIP
jgi:hypothetical protein